MNNPRKNLFDFANKELSQDAFLRWLLENVHDPTIGKATKALLSAFAAKFDGRHFDAENIRGIQTEGQSQHADVVATVRVGENGEKCIFLIEDKVESKEHGNQLDRYFNKVKKRYGVSEESLYPIYYKTGWMEEEEREQVADKGWKIMDLRDALDVFIDFQDAKNDILSDYAKHLADLSRWRSEVSPSPAKDWNFEQWRGYFSAQLKPDIQKNVSSKIEFLSWVYRGYNLSFCVYFPFLLDKKSQPFIEFKVRLGGAIGATFRFASYKDGELNADWEVSFMEEGTKEAVSRDLREGKLPSFRSFNRKKCLASIKRPLEEGKWEELNDSIVTIVRETQDYFLTFWGSSAVKSD